MSDTQITIKAADGSHALEGTPVIQGGYVLSREMVWVDAGGGERTCSGTKATLVSSIELGDKKKPRAVHKDLKEIVHQKVIVETPTMSFAGYCVYAQLSVESSQDESPSRMTVHVTVEGEEV